MTAPTFVASSGASRGNTNTPLVVNRPAGRQNGDVLIAFATCNAGSATLIPPAGWTARTQNTDMAMYVLTTTVTDPAVASDTWNLNVNSHLNVAVVAYRDALEPPEAQGFSAITGSASVTAPSVTTLGADRTIVMGVAVRDTMIVPAPAGTTRRVYSQGTFSLAAVDFIQVSQGATPTKTFTKDGFTQLIWAACTLAVAPGALSNVSFFDGAAWAVVERSIYDGTAWTPRSPAAL